MTQTEIKEVLRKHSLWLKSNPEGERANLRGANLRGANLQEANLRLANLQEANLRLADLQGADLRLADLQEANLQRANLQEANLQGANLRLADLQGADLRLAYLQGADLRWANLHGADLDYSAWPLWCGSLDVKVDVRIARQIAYHFCRLDCSDPEYLRARNLLIDFANGFHRVNECGELKKSEEG